MKSLVRECEQIDLQRDSRVKVTAEINGKQHESRKGKLMLDNQAHTYKASLGYNSEFQGQQKIQ